VNSNPLFTKTTVVVSRSEEQVTFVPAIGCALVAD
jgi:hypothetical protein